MAEHFTGYGAVPIDFGGIGSIPETYTRARQGAVRERVLSEIGQGKLDPAAASQKLFAAGLPDEGISLARLAESRGDRAESRAFRREEAERAQRNADRSYKLQEMTLNEGRVPPGFTRGVNGDLAPITNGPADPDYIQRVAGAKEKPRQFNVSDVTKLSEEGGKFGSLNQFNDTFEDRFAGYKLPAAGSAAMTAGRFLPESVVGKDVAEGATWWQGYDKYKNVVRNDLFGSALTPSEQAAFEKADVSPGMDPGQIKKNLKIQKEVVGNGLKRKANALITSGYDPVAISQAYGVDLKELGVTATGRGGKTQERAPSAPAVAAPPQAVQELRARVRRDPRAAEQFDEVFGAGSAARALGVIQQ